MGSPENRTADFEHRLKRAGLERWRIAVFSIVSYAPAGAIVVCTPLVILTVGFASPIFFLIGGVVIVLLATIVAELSKRIPSAGFFYTMNAQIFGPGAGFVTGWLMFPGYSLIVIGGLAYASFWAQLLAESYGLDLPFWIPFFALTAVVFVFTYWGIRPSINFDTTVLGVEMVVLLALAVTALVTAKAPAPVSTADIFGAGVFGGGAFPGLQAVAFALVFGAICPYVGFENPTSLAEETPEPRKRIPFGVIVGAIFGAVFYTFWHWAVIASYGGELVPQVAEGGQPIQVLSDGLWGTRFLPLVAFVALYGTMGFVLSFANTVIRALYAMGREGLLPRALGRTHPRLQTPTTAIIFQTVLTVAVGLPLGAAVGGDFAWFYLSFVAFVAVIVVYGSVCIALVRLMLTRYREEFSLVRHAVVPTVVLVVLALTLVLLTVWPAPVSPYNYLAYGLGAYIVAGFVALRVLRRKAPDELQRAGAILAGLEEAEASRPSHRPEMRPLI